MADSAEDRRAAAAARQAKLLAKSSERLAKITGAAKGEGRVPSDAAVGISPSSGKVTDSNQPQVTSPPSSSTPFPEPVLTSGTGTTTTTVNPAPPKSLSPQDDDPEEVDLQTIHTPGVMLANSSSQRGGGVGGNDTSSLRNRNKPLSSQEKAQEAQLEAMFGPLGAGPPGMGEGRGGGGPFGQGGFPPGMMGFGGMGGAGAGAGAGGLDDMVAQMMTMLGGGSGPTPLGPDGQPMPSNPFSAGPEGGGGGRGLSGMMQPPASPFPPSPKTWIDRIFPLIHFLSMVILGVSAVAWLEPQSRSTTLAYMMGKSHSSAIISKINWSAWGALSGSRPSSSTGTWNTVEQFTVLSGNLAQVPLLWMFVTVELVLQTTQLLLLRNRPRAPGIISSLIPIVSQFSPQLGLTIETGLKYIDLLSISLNDLAVLVFTLGMAVLLGKWKTGRGIVDTGVDSLGGGSGIGWNTAKVEL